MAAAFGEELAFLKTQALALRNVPLTFGNDYQPALEDLPKRIAIFPIPVPPPPTKAQPSPSSSSDTIPIVVKSTKPPLTFQLTVSPTDTIAQIKAQLEKQYPRAPTADLQRLLLKGKVLADSKLLKEYPISDSTTITLMTKPGSAWTGEERKESEPVAASPVGEVVATEPEKFAAPKPTASSSASLSTARLGHGRSLSGAADSMPLPTLTLSPNPSPDNQNVDLALAVELDLQNDQVRGMTPKLEAYQQVMVDPEFWGRMLEFLKREFKTPDDAVRAWEDFFVASKGNLTAHQIAKIRDVTGIVSMAGF